MAEPRFYVIKNEDTVCAFFPNLDEAKDACADMQRWWPEAKVVVAERVDPE